MFINIEVNLKQKQMSYNEKKVLEIIEASKKDFKENTNYTNDVWSDEAIETFEMSHIIGTLKGRLQLAYDAIDGLKELYKS